MAAYAESFEGFNRSKGATRGSPQVARLCYIFPPPAVWRLYSGHLSIFQRENFQSFFTVGSLDTFSATPRGNGLSPILKIVPDCSKS
jgi:hypothetical protein